MTHRVRKNSIISLPTHPHRMAYQYNHDNESINIRVTFRIHQFFPQKNERKNFSCQIKSNTRGSILYKLLKKFSPSEILHH